MGRPGGGGLSEDDIGAGDCETVIAHQRTPRQFSVTPCSPPSRTPSAPLRGCCAILDRGCARRPSLCAVGTEKRFLVEQRNRVEAAARKLRLSSVLPA